LDRLSGGRLVLGVGAGGDAGDFTSFGEPVEAPARIGRLDESIALVDALLRGEVVRHEGPAYFVRDVAVGPRPVQDPRPPIWLGGMRPGALRRAARWDGWIAIAVSDDGSGINLTSDAFGEMVERVNAERAALGRSSTPFDIAVFAFSEPFGPDLARAFSAAGATWWLESLSPMRGSIDDLLSIVATGPPRP
jgi:alkanesulfonate monooxygenase SsuD/methylene tetrahydromethanopterin reductase-like flavin-dependent oxidoreductase (luciferase family)